MALSESEVAAFKAFEKTGWERAADAYHDHWGGLSSQSADAMLDAAAVKPGVHVLDVATGAGYIVGAAADRGARAIGLDFSTAQVALARQVHPDVEFRVGSAEALPYESATFDAVVMGFGMNHLPDPEKAVLEAFRVLKPGGRFAFTVWAAPRPGEGFGIVLSAIETEGVPNPDLPPAPPYFRFAEATTVAEVLQSAGFVDVSTSLVEQQWRHSSPEQVFDAFNEGAVRATAMLQSQPNEVRKKIRVIVRREVEKLRIGDEFVIPVPAALSAGRKPWH